MSTGKRVALKLITGTVGGLMGVMIVAETFTLLLAKTIKEIDPSFVTRWDQLFYTAIQPELRLVSVKSP